LSTLRSSGGLRPFQPQQFGRFTLLAPIAAGGMGQIYLARARFAGGLEKLCVIKKILPELARDPGFAARFREEARTLIQLQHGSIAQVYDSGEEAGEWWIAMEFVDGKDLRRLMQRMRASGRRIPLDAALYVAVKILEALAYAHRKKDEAGNDLGLVHRDVSPQNVLLSYEGEVKVIDFGLARSRISEPERNPAVVMGKFHYMAPEQARNLPLDRRADLYAVGVVLYEAITGWNPFEEAAPAEVVEWAATPRIPPIQRLAQDVPPSLAQAMARALAIDPAQRFGSAEEMRAALSACLAEVAPAAGPELLADLLLRTFADDYARERAWFASLNGGEAVLYPAAVPPDEATRAAPPAGEPFATGAAPPGHAGAITEPRLAAPLPPGEVVPWDRDRSNGAAALRSAAAAATSTPRGVPWYESASARGWRPPSVPRQETTPPTPIPVHRVAVEVEVPGATEAGWAVQDGPTPPARMPAHLRPRVEAGAERLQDGETPPRGAPAGAGWLERTPQAVFGAAQADGPDAAGEGALPGGGAATPPRGVVFAGEGAAQASAGADATPRGFVGSGANEVPHGDARGETTPPPGLAIAGADAAPIGADASIAATPPRDVLVAGAGHPAMQAEARVEATALVDPTRSDAGQQAAEAARPSRRRGLLVGAAAALVLGGIVVASRGGNEEAPARPAPPAEVQQRVEAPVAVAAPEPAIVPAPAPLAAAPQPAEPAPEPAPREPPPARPEPAPVAPAAAAPQKRPPRRDPKQALLAQRRRVMGKYEALVRTHGADQVGGIIAGLVRATDSQFQRLIDDPGHHDDLQRQLDELDRLLEERRLAFAR